MPRPPYYRHKHCAASAKKADAIKKAVCSVLVDDEDSYLEYVHCGDDANTVLIIKREGKRPDNGVYYPRAW